MEPLVVFESILKSPLFKSKEQNLRKKIRGLKKVIVAFSGGVDSSVVAKVSSQELGKGALVLIGDSPSLSRENLKIATQIAKEHHFYFKTVNVFEHYNPKYFNNPKNRCFFCKFELYETCKQVKLKENYEAILDGSHIDDLSDDRPGEGAAKKKGVVSVLKQFEFNKKEIRAFAYQLKLKNYQKIAEPCLASRVLTGIKITKKVLNKVEQAEAFLKKLGFLEVRVRYHGNFAKIEVPFLKIKNLFSFKKIIETRFKKIGFEHITIDLIGLKKSF